MNFNSLSSLNLFSSEIKGSFLFHIPHASTFIPYKNGAGFDKGKIDEEIKKLTDWETDKIFNVPNIDRIIVPFSRIFCDVERLPDNEEPMFIHGRGFYYTCTDSGKFLRNEKLKKDVYENYYLKHHEQFHQMVQNKLNDFEIVYIVDCHSFPNVPLKSDTDQSKNRPDICIGIDEFHTPSYFLNHVKNHFENHGFSVSVNTPYSGTIVPLPFYKKDKRVNSIMIEINRNLYMDKNNSIIKTSKILYLNNIISELFNF